MNNINLQQLKIELNFSSNPDINKIVKDISDNSSLSSVLDTINSQDTRKEKGKSLVTLFSYIIENCDFITNPTAACCIYSITQLLEKTDLHKKVQQAFNNAVTRQASKIQQYALAQQTQAVIATHSQQTEVSSATDVFPIFQLPREILLQILQGIEIKELQGFFASCRQAFDLRPARFTQDENLTAKIYMHYLCPQNSSTISQLPPMRQTLLAEIQRQAARVTHLNLNHMGITDDNLIHITQIFPNVQSLSLSGIASNITPISGKGLQALKRCKELRSLTLRFTTISDKDLESLQYYPKLEKLNISFNQVGDKGLESLQHCPKLKELDISTTNVSDKGLESLQHCPKLKELNISGTNVSDKGLESLRHCPELQSLKISYTSITGTGFQSLQYCQQLQNLVALNAKITDAGMASLPHCPALQSFNLSQTQITDIKFLKQCPQLQSLNLCNTEITDVSLESLQYCLELRWLNLARCNGVKNDGDKTIIKILDYFKELQTLNLENITISKASLQRLVQEKNLRYLLISPSGISTSELCKQLSKLTSLKKLQTTHHKMSGLTVEDIQQLQTLPHLRHLRVGRCSEKSYNLLLGLFKNSPVHVDNLVNIDESEFNFHWITRK